MSNRALAPALLALLPLTGCLPAVAPIEEVVASRVVKPEPGQALVYVAREKKIAGMGSTMIMFRDGERMGDVSNGTFLYFPVAPGEHTVTVSHEVTNPPRVAELPLRAEAGQTYFIKVFWADDVWPHITQVHEYEARSLLSRIKLSPTFRAAVVKLKGSGGPAVAGPAEPPPPLEPGFRRAERADDVALVIGVERYSSIPKAEFAERDAQAVQAHLLALGVPRRNMIHLAGSQAAYASVKKYLESWLPRNVKPGSRVYFYFSGHGAPDVETGEAYLMPWDGDPAFLKDTAYPTKRLYEQLAALPAKEVIVAMDACFSGGGGRSVLAKGARPLVTKVETGPVAGSLTVFSASEAEQITSTLEDKGHGMFTYFFLKGLGGEAKDRSGAVTAKGLYDYLRPNVQDEARRQNRDQDPVLQGASERELIRF